jgi:hypothetical protein
MKKKEIVSFNPVVRDVSSLVELDDKELEQTVGGANASNGLIVGCIANDYDPNSADSCNTLC